MYFDLENSAGCTKDYLKIYDSDIAGMAPGTLLGTFCGSTTPTVRFGTQRYLTLEFHADSSGSGDGFRFRGTRTEPSKSFQYHRLNGFIYSLSVSFKTDYILWFDHC